jgi:Homing endonuclease associated repeat
MTRRAQQAAIAQQLRVEGSGGEGLSISAVAREMGISVSYAGELLVDPTGERARARKAKSKQPAKKRKKRKPKFTRSQVIEAMQEWHKQHGRPPYANEWSSNAGLPVWVPSTRTVYNLFGEGGWNKAVGAAGFTPRSVAPPEWTRNLRQRTPL